MQTSTKAKALKRCDCGSCKQRSSSQQGQKDKRAANKRLRRMKGLGLFWASLPRG